MDSSFFGASCRLKLSRLEPSTADKLKRSFARFIERVIDYIDEYYLLKKKINMEILLNLNVSFHQKFTKLSVHLVYQQLMILHGIMLQNVLNYYK